MPFFYKKLDFTLHFARFDNSPNVVTESLSSCVPVIALNHAGSPEHVFSSSAGFIVDQVDDLPALVLSIISGHVDINALKKKAYAYSNKVLSPCSMASAYFKLFNQST